MDNLIKLVSFILNDAAHVTYTEPDLLAAFNQSVKSTCLVRPDASSDISEVVLVAGSRQRLPPEALRLIAPCYRLDDDGKRYPLELVSRHDLDRLQPNWINAAGIVRELAIDERLPDFYWCNAPAREGEKLELAYNTLPESFTALTGQFPLSAKYEPVVAEYMLYLLLNRDSADTVNVQLAFSHLDTFRTLLGLKTQAEQMTSPVTAGQ